MVIVLPVFVGHNFRMPSGILSLHFTKIKKTNSCNFVDKDDLKNELVCFIAWFWYRDSKNRNM